MFISAANIDIFLQNESLCFEFFKICLANAVAETVVSVSAMLVSIHKKNIAQAFILERYFFVSIYPAVIPGTSLMVFLVVALLLCLLHQIYIQRS